MMVHVTSLLVFLCLPAAILAAFSDYEREQGQFIAKYVMGSLLQTTPELCAAECDVTERCLGFNFNREDNRCTLLEHNKFTVPFVYRYRANARLDHYAKRDASYRCPEGSFPHPYKARCYIVVNTKTTWHGMSQECRDRNGYPLLMPNALTKSALWQPIQDRLDPDSDSVWVALQFLGNQGEWVRRGSKSPYLWTANLVRGNPYDNRHYCGAMVVGAGGKVDYFRCTETKAFVCEIRAHTDNTINEICPHDTGLFDANCYWGSTTLSTRQEAEENCLERGGNLAVFNTEESIRYIGSIWGQVVGEDTLEPWIGLRFTHNQWMWDNWDTTMLELFATDSERSEGMSESCATAKREGAVGLQWYSQHCTRRRPYLCMGRSGVAISEECPTRECPLDSLCTEGPMESTCRCNAGFSTIYNQSMMECREASVCQANGDPHYMLWDGAKQDYQGLCTHLLAGVCPGHRPLLGYPSFQIYGHNARRSTWRRQDVTFTDWVEVHLYGQVVHLGLDMFLRVNGEEKVPEYTMHPYDDERFITIKARSANNILILGTDFGLMVRFSQYAATIILTQYYKNVMCGICGNYNGIPADDTGTDMQKWMIREDRSKPECQVENPYVTVECEVDMQAYAEEKCGIINTMSLLDECRESEDVKMSQFYENCMTDACAATQADTAEILCETMEAIRAVCDATGYPVSVAYRALTDCRVQCELHSEYDPAADLDAPSCQNPDGIYLVPSGSGEACTCDVGYIEEGGYCIPVEGCGCYYEDQDLYMKIGMTYTNSDCTLKVTCQDDGVIVEQNMSCGRNAECVQGISIGRRVCRCRNGFEGNAYEECTAEQICPYPMPEANTAAALDAFAVNVATDSTQDIVDILVGTNITNTLCETVTCYDNNHVTVSPSQCVRHASCVPHGSYDYKCVCDAGYAGDPEVRCEEDTSGNGDPHFLVTSHSSGKHFCFDVHGYQSEVWSLIRDVATGIYVNGELFETQNSKPGQPQAYFGRIAVITNDMMIIFARTGILVNDMYLYQWNDTFTSYGYMTQEGRDVILLELRDDVAIRIARSYANTIGYYLGVVLSNSDGLTRAATGIIGMFLGASFDIAYGDDRSSQMMFRDFGVSVPVTEVSRYYRAHRGIISCWHYNAMYDGDALLGPKITYSLDKLTAT